MSNRWLVVAALVAALPVAGVSHAQEGNPVLGGRSVVVWYPGGPAGVVRHPVVVFSHGLGGCPTQSQFLTRGLAAQGYLVIAPFHRDAGCGRRKTPPRPAKPFSEPGRWDDRTYADRVEDVRAVVAALPSSPLAGIADLNQLAVAGHSLGGYTALSLGGAWTLTRMPQVRAVLALAPYAAPFLAHGTMSDLLVPVMFQSGALDDGITTAVRRRGGAFDAAGGPKYFVEFSGARHSSWGNKPHAAQDAMLAYAIAFLDRYVRGNRDSAVLGRKLTGVTEMRVSEAP